MPAPLPPRNVLAGIALASLGALVALTAGCKQTPERTDAGSTPLPSASASAPGTASRATPQGRLSVVQWPNLTIDNKPLRAAPGARIINSNNMMMTPNMIPAGARVEYQLDGAGQVRLLRILDTRDAAPSPAAPRPQTPPQQ